MRQVRVAVAVQIYLSKRAEGISVMRPVHDGTMRRLITRRTTPCKNAWIQVDGCPEVSGAAYSSRNYMPTQAKLVEQAENTIKWKAIQRWYAHAQAQAQRPALETLSAAGMRASSRRWRCARATNR